MGSPEHGQAIASATAAAAAMNGQARSAAPAELKRPPRLPLALGAAIFISALHRCLIVSRLLVRRLAPQR